MNYRTLKEKHQKEINNFTKKYMIYALNKDQLTEGLKEKGFKASDMVQIMGGGFLIKSKEHDLDLLLNKQIKEKKEYILKDPDNFKDAYIYEAFNYELEISLSYTYDTFLTEILYLTPEEIEENQNTIKEASEEYKKEFYENF